MNTPSHAEHNAIRPEGRTPRRRLATALEMMRRAVGGDRFENLYRALAAALEDAKLSGRAPHDGRWTLLDYGCGTMSFAERLWAEGRIDDFVGMDTFPRPEAADAAAQKWAHYRQIPPQGIDPSGGRFDLAMVVDVLHHAAPADRAGILRSLAGVSGVVVVKDHFEHGPLSRQMLRLADWYGNFAYGVVVPDRYFDPSSWRQLVNEAGMRELKTITQVRVHEGLFGVMVPPRCHFISLLSA